MPISRLFSDILSKHSDFIITTHISCDGDGLGAGAGLVHGLKKLNKSACFALLDTPDECYSFLNEKNIMKNFNEVILKKDLGIIAVDVNETELIEPLYSSALKKDLNIYFIDHHPLASKKENCSYIIDTDASSTGEIIFSLLKKANIELDKDIATALYTSIIFDTKRFRFIKNSSLPFKISTELIDCIPDVEFIYNKMFKTLSVKQLEFYSRLKNVEYYKDNKLALFHITEKDLNDHEGNVGLACELLDMLMTVKDVNIACLIIEKPQKKFKLSLRSTKEDLLPVIQIFGGGGHKRSCGAYVKDFELNNLKRTLVTELSKLV